MTSSERSAKRQMGFVYASITIRNRLDERDARVGRIEPNDVRTLVLDRVLVDTGASTLALPAPMIAALGLELIEEVSAHTASGIVRARVFRDASLSVDGRVGDFRCLELPAAAQPLLGVLPMKELGIEPDIINHELRFLPRGQGGKTHILLMGPLLAPDP